GITLWDPAQGRMLVSLTLATTRAVFFHPVSSELLASSLAGFHHWSWSATATPTALRLRLGAIMTSQDLPTELGKFALSADGKSAAVVHQTEIVVFDPRRPAEHFVLPAGTLYQDLALSPEGKYLAARTREGSQLHVWDVARRTRST